MAQHAPLLSDSSISVRSDQPGIFYVDGEPKSEQEYREMQVWDLACDIDGFVSPRSSDWGMDVAVALARHLMGRVS